MENYIKEIIDVCKLPFGEIYNEFKVIQIGEGVIYICNYKKIIDYSPQKIVLKVKNNTLEIAGSDMFISQINKGEIIIKGCIQSCGLGVIHEKKNKQ